MGLAFLKDTLVPAVEKAEYLRADKNGHSVLDLALRWSADVDVLVAASHLWAQQEVFGSENYRHCP